MPGKTFQIIVLGIEEARFLGLKRAAFLIELRLLALEAFQFEGVVHEIAEIAVGQQENRARYENEVPDIFRHLALVPDGAPASRNRRKAGTAGPSENNRRYTAKAPPLAYLAFAPSSASILRSWLYLHSRSERQGAPVFMAPALTATARSAMNASSVSPER